MEQCSPTKYTSSLSERENVVPRWSFVLNSTLATAETWDIIRVETAVF